MELVDRIARDFSYHPPTGDSVKKMKSIRDYAKVLALLIEKYVPAGREQSLALTKLEEVSMWANAGIARLQPKEEDASNQLSLFTEPEVTNCSGRCKGCC